MAVDTPDFKASEAPPIEYQADLLDVQRKRKLAEALMAQGMAPMPQGQMISGHYVAPSITQGLSQVLKAYLGNKRAAEADADQLGIMKRYGADLQAARVKMAGLPDEEAVRYGEQSPFGQLNNLAATRRKDLAARLTKGAEMAGPTTGLPALQAGSMAGLRPPESVPPEFSSTTIQTENGPVQMPTVINTDPMTGKQTGSYGHVPSRVSAIAGSEKVDDKIAVNNAEAANNYFMKAQPIAERNLKILQSSQEIVRQLNDPELRAGYAGQPLNILNKAAVLFGLEPATDPAKFETLRATLKQRMFDLLGSLGAQVSDSDRRAAEQIVGGKWDDPGTLRELALITAKYARKGLADYNAKLQESTGPGGVYRNQGGGPRMIFSLPQQTIDPELGKALDEREARLLQEAKGRAMVRPPPGAAPWGQPPPSSDGRMVTPAQAPTVDGESPEATSIKLNINNLAEAKRRAPPEKRAEIQRLIDAEQSKLRGIVKMRRQWGAQ